MTLEQLKNAIDAAFEVKSQRRRERLNQAQREAAERNNGAPPTEDRDGRWHAPFDGYYYNDGQREGEYLAGEYLPIPEDEDDLPRGGGRGPDSRIKDCEAARVVELAKEYPVTGGQEYQVEGVACCYAYLAPLGCAEAERLIADYLQANVAELIAKRAQRIKNEKKARAEAKERALPVPVTGERIEIEGNIVSRKLVENFYQGGDTLKILIVTKDGWTVWGTCPSALAGEVGDRVSFTARIEPAKDDPKHGFYSRPTKAKTIEAAA